MRSCVDLLSLSRPHEGSRKYEGAICILVHVYLYLGVCSVVCVCVCQINKWKRKSQSLACGSSLPAATLKNHCGGHCTTVEPLKQQHAYREKLEWCACSIAKPALRLESLYVL